MTHAGISLYVLGIKYNSSVVVPLYILIPQVLHWFVPAFTRKFILIFSPHITVVLVTLKVMFSLHEVV